MMAVRLIEALTSVRAMARTVVSAFVKRVEMGDNGGMIKEKELVRLL